MMSGSIASADDCNSDDCKNYGYRDEREKSRKDNFSAKSYANSPQNRDG